MLPNRTPLRTLLAVILAGGTVAGVGAPRPVTADDEPAAPPPSPILQRVLGPDACMPGVGLCAKTIHWGMSPRALGAALELPVKTAPCIREPYAPLVGAGLSAIDEWRGAGREWRSARSRDVNDDTVSDDGPGVELICLQGGIDNGVFGNIAGLEPGKRVEVVGFGDAGGGLAAIGLRYQWAADFDAPIFLQRTVTALEARLGKPVRQQENAAWFQIESGDERAAVVVWVARYDAADRQRFGEDDLALSTLRIYVSAISTPRTEAAARADAREKVGAWKARVERELSFQGDEELAAYALQIGRRDQAKAPCNAARQLAMLRHDPASAKAAGVVLDGIFARILREAEAERRAELQKLRGARSGGKASAEGLALLATASAPAVKLAAVVARPDAFQGRKVAWSGVVVEQVREDAWLVWRPEGAFVLVIPREGGRPSSLEYVIAEGWAGRERRYGPDGSRLVPTLTGKLLHERRLPGDEYCSLDR